MSRRTILIVGASLAAVTVAESLRSQGSNDRIVMLGDEVHLPYDRPPLSKNQLVSAQASAEDLAFHPREWYSENGIELHLGDAAVHLELEQSRVLTESGAIHAFDELVIATGSSPRKLDGFTPGPSVHYLRSVDDGESLRRTLGTPGHLVIIGAGFIGLEVAGTALSSGWTVTLVERDNAPLSRVLPAALAQRCWEPYEAAGATLLCEATPQSARSHDSAQELLLSDGTVVPFDGLLVSAGGIPNSDWLGDAFPGHATGIPCDAFGRTDVANVWSLGDVAAWSHGRSGARARVEQWQAAVDQGVVLARALLGETSVGWQEHPYFWSDMLHGRIQFVGRMSPSMDLHVHEIGNGKSVGLLSRDGLLMGVFAEKYPRAMAKGRLLLDADASVEDGLAWLSEIKPQIQL